MRERVCEESSGRETQERGKEKEGGNRLVHIFFLFF